MNSLGRGSRMGLERVLGLCLLLLLVACQPKAVSVPPGTEVIRCFEGAYRMTLEKDESGSWVLVLRSRPDPSVHWVRWALSVAIPGESTGDANSISGSLTTVVSSGDELILGRVYPLDVKPGQQMVISFGLNGPGPEGHVFYSESVHLCRLAEGYAILEETRGRGETTIEETPPELLTLTPQTATLMPTTPTPTPPLTPRPAWPTPTPTSLPDTVQLVLWALAGQFRVNPAEIELVHWQVVKWPDACLGVPMRAPCSKTITPGYRIILEIGGQPYEYRSNLDGSYFLLAAPEVQIEDPVLIWEGDEPNGCQSLALAADGPAAIGPCGAPQTPLYLLDGVQRPQQLAYLLARFTPFYAETVAGQVTFQGRGREIATPAWQRAIVTWARLVREELQFGRSGASWGLALAWHGEGETAGFCDHLQVESYGLAFASTSRCGGGEAQTLGQAWLDTAELEQLYAWQDRLASFELPGRLVFTGTGSMAATEAEVQAILDWAERLWKHIVANTPKLSDVPAMGCPHTPVGGFYDVWQNEQVRPRLGCPLAPAIAITGQGGFNVNPICSYSTNGGRHVARRGLCLGW